MRDERKDRKEESAKSNRGSTRKLGSFLDFDVLSTEETVHQSFGQGNARILTVDEKKRFKK